MSKAYSKLQYSKVEHSADRRKHLERERGRRFTTEINRKPDYGTQESNQLFGRHRILQTGKYKR